MNSCPEIDQLLALSKSAAEEVEAWAHADECEACRTELEILRHVAQALDLLSTHPEVGVKCALELYPELRRLHLRRIRCYLYYKISLESLAVDVVALWHTSRESEPPMQSKSRPTTR